MPEAEWEAEFRSIADDVSGYVKYVEGQVPPAHDLTSPQLQFATSLPLRATDDNDKKLHKFGVAHTMQV